MLLRSLVVVVVGGGLFLGLLITNAPVTEDVTSVASDDAASRAATQSRGQARPDDPPVSLAAIPPVDSYIGYPEGPLPPAAPGEMRAMNVVVRNEGKTVWESAGENAVKLSYHLYDNVGGLLAWDGVRTPLPHDIAPGFAGVLPLQVVLPGRTGTYAVKPDLLRDGKSWFSSTGASPAGLKVRVTTDFDAGYGTTTAPATVVPGAEVNIRVPLKNTGLKSWPAGGDHPVRLGYHWFDMSSQAVVWDGARTALPHDVAPGEEVTLMVDMRFPSADGAYALAWDMVQDGKSWFSTAAVPMKEELVVVQKTVTFYGKGWGHGIGLSQWGAQGWAEGASGVRLTGEQIVAHYFPGAQLSTHPIAKPFRVLLSAPSTACIGQTIWSVARMESAGGMRLVNDADPSVVYFEAAPYQGIRFTTDGASTLIATDTRSGRRVYVGDGAVTLVPIQWWDPIDIDQKDLAYRGNIQVGVRDGGYLRVVNFVSSDDYMRGALPGEMPNYWEMEALRAQAITARTYAAWRQATAGDRTWDVRDDTADQCYGGHSFESRRTSAAVDSTASLVLTYSGQPIRALYSSAHGGISENVGCLLDAERVPDGWRCAEGWPYLGVVQDPAELHAYDARGSMPYGLWAATFTGDAIRSEVLEDYGVDIGEFVSIEFNMSPGGRPISVVVRGSRDFVNVKGDRFLRTTLGLRSTLVRMIPF